MAELDDYSRFSKTPPIIYEGKETFGRWKLYSFLTTRPAEDLIGVFKVSSALEGRPDKISEAIYGTPYLFWVLIAFNNARATLNWPRSGDTIEYPVESVVVPEVLQ